MVFKGCTSPSARLEKDTVDDILEKKIDKKKSTEADSVLDPQRLPYTLAPSCGITLTCVTQNKLKLYRAETISGHILCWGQVKEAVTETKQY